MRVIIALSCLSLCHWSQALATDPAPATDAPTATASASAPAPNSSAAPAATSSSSSSQLVTPEIDKQLRSQGFKREVRKGDLYYCRTETILGSHFEQKSCRTAERIMAERTSAQDVTRRAQIETQQTAGK